LKIYCTCIYIGSWGLCRCHPTSWCGHHLERRVVVNNSL